MLCATFVHLTLLTISASLSQAGQSTESAQVDEGFSSEKLEQVVAPIALYPDPLLTQILMASTYPLEIVQAARWSEKNSKLKGDKLEAALKDQTWDPSVKSLCGFPDVIKRMSDNLDWTQDLGDAFLADESKLMDSVQTMRRKAYEAGNLTSGKEQAVTEQPDKIIIIQAADPEVIYVPTYYPTAVYGAWSYPHWYYPPLYPPPPAGAFMFGFTVGVIWGSAMWGGCHWGWGHSDVNINVNHYNTFVNKTEIEGRRKEVRDKAGSGGNWKHDPQHRKGVSYKDNRVAQKYGAGPGQSRISREQARGFSGRGSQASKAGGRNVKPSTSSRQRSPSSSSRSRSSTGLRSSAHSGSRSPGFDRAASARGSASRRSAGSRQAAPRSGRRRR